MLGCTTPHPPTPPQPPASPKDKVAQHRNHCCGGCVTRAGSITPRTHDQQRGLSRAGHKFGGAGGGGFWTFALFCCQQVKICVEGEKCFHVDEVYVGRGASHAAQKPATRGYFAFRCTATLMTASSRWFVVFKVMTHIHPAYSTFTEGG